MKHVKLFENFKSQSNPIIKVQEDYSKLTLDGYPVDFLFPNATIVTYYENPPQGMRGMDFYDLDYFDGPIAPQDLYKLFELQPDELGEDGYPPFYADPSYTPEDYRKAFQEEVDRINQNPKLEIGMFMDAEDDPQFTEEFKKHLEALSTGNTSNLMRPRAELDFKVV